MTGISRARVLWKDLMPVRVAKAAALPARNNYFLNIRHLFRNYFRDELLMFCYTAIY
jgi:hypothetical protein